MPCRHGFLRRPHREAPPPDQGGIIVWPVRHLEFRLGDLAAAAVIELIRHGLSGPEKLALGILIARARARHRLS